MKFPNSKLASALKRRHLSPVTVAKECKTESERNYSTSLLDVIVPDYTAIEEKTQEVKHCQVVYACRSNTNNPREYDDKKQM